MVGVSMKRGWVNGWKPWVGLAAVCLSLYCSPALADCGGSPGYGMCANVRITTLYIDINADGWLQVSGNVSALPGCSPSDGVLIRVPSAAPNFKAVYATLLAAHMAGRNVNVRIDPNASTCTVAYVTVP